jgi:hypothetical protein
MGGNVMASQMEVGEDFLFVNTANFSDHEVKIIDLQTQRYIGSIAGMPSGETLGRGMARSGDSLYLSTGTGVIRRAEISQPHSPVAVASIDVSNYLYGGDANASHLFQTDLIDGLLVFDISDPLNPQHIATASTPGYSRDAVLNGHHLYVADGAEGLAVFDVSNPANPYRLYNYKLYGTTTDLRRLSIDRENDLLFAANMYGGVAAYQLHVPAQPLQVSIASPLQSGAVESVHADGFILYTAESPGENITRYSYDENGSFVGSHSFQEGNSNTHDVATIYVDGMSFPIYTHDGLEPKYYLDFSLMFGEDNTYLSILADGFIVGLETLGPYLLGSMSANGLEVRSAWQSMNPNHPSRIIQTPTNTMAARVTLGGDYAYAPDLGGGVQVIHVAMLKYFEEESRSVEQNGTLYDLYDPVSISFNKPILPQSVSGQISIQQNGNPIFWNEDINGTTLSLVPAGGQWATGSEYNITIDGNLMDIYNNHLGDGLPAGFIEWIFHTEP